MNDTAQSEIRRVFDRASIGSVRSIKAPRTDPASAAYASLGQTTNVAWIALVCIAGLIIFCCLIGMIVICYSYSRYGGPCKGGSQENKLRWVG